MTAEIAILNRTAVALAADSIVTLAGGLRPKTYDSAEKIFELSRHQPIALMIYNNAQFMNAPLEIIIRRYREQVTLSQFKELVQVWPDFEKFLLGFKHELADELEHLQNFAISELHPLKANLFNHMVDTIGRRRKKNSESSEDVLVRRCRERQREAEGSPLPGGIFEEFTLEAFSERYGETLSEIAAKVLPPSELTEAVHSAICAMMFAVIKSDVQSTAFTGFVFAGFGSEDLFPTLHAIEVDGVYFGRFRILDTKLVDIDRRGETAAVVPFAQKDMPERFILGIDRETETALADLASNLVGHVLDQTKPAFKNEHGDAIKAAAVRQFHEGVERLKKRHANSLNSVVNHLSKKELAEVAYSLVELTSRKRRYSRDMETVGGPIDVAILTRNEGFIWVRRKHYFDTDLNPRYVKSLSGSSGHG